MVKLKEKTKAISLRKKGLSYSEILKEVPVAKSTLSLWLRKVGLAKKQKQRLTLKKLAAAKKGWESKKRKRILLTEKIKEKARTEIKKISRRDLFIIGIALYWGEGHKAKEHYNISQRVRFSNSDTKMILIFMKWLKEICHKGKDDLYYSLIIHETANWKKARIYWSKLLKIPKKTIRVYLKRAKKKTNRKNIEKDYHGVINITVKKSTNLNRKISGWIEGVFQNCGVG